MKEYEITKACEEITEEIGELMQRRKGLQAELTELIKRDNKSKWYKQKKVSKTPVSSDVDSASRTGSQRTSPSPIPSSDNSAASDIEPFDEQCSRSVSVLSDDHDTSF